jgi:hypothetical protein
MSNRWEEARRIEKEIRDWCEEQSPMPNVPQAAKDIVWKLAWEHGHSSGRSEIFFYYDDFADIARTTLTELTSSKAATEEGGKDE